jgi:hypothetical protein
MTEDERMIMNDELGMKDEETECSNLFTKGLEDCSTSRLHRTVDLQKFKHALCL